MTQERSPESPGYDIAVVGLALHFPGARTPEAYWRNLEAGVESIRDLSDEELAAAGVRPETRARPNYVRRGVVLEDMEHFDAAFFGFSPKDAAIADPQHRHFLECAWEALEDAGHPPERFRGSVGVFAGSGMAAYLPFNLLSNPELVDEVGLFLLRHTANDKDFLATRVSYALDLRGPSVNVQTACSTSLVAIHVACQSLLSGECDMALAGGSSILLPHRTGYHFHEGEILSPDGRCRVFEKRSKGTVFGNGCGIVVLRRLDDALKDGDHVRAVIRGSAVNNDGSMKAGYLAPSVDGQAEAILQAIGVSGISAETIGYVEAHGTGTAVGDPIEVAALTQAFRASTGKRGFCALTSVKPNIGHLDTAAGVASFIKATLALEHGAIPPCLHFEEANPEIDFAASPFHVPAKKLAWERSGAPRRAGVSSLGVGGTNAHTILEEAPERAPSPPAGPWQVLTLSARSQAALDRVSQRLRERLREHPDWNFADVAWTLQVGRRAFAWRRSFAARDATDAAQLLEKSDPQRTATNQVASEPDGVVFLFPGGGAQYPTMARGLYENERTFRSEVGACLALLEPDLRATVRRVLFPEPGTEAAAAKELERPAVQLPALFIVEYALAKTWIAHGIAPKALLGHSMGENTAACVAGVIDLRGALGLVVLRGRLFEKVKPGGMLSVPLAAEELRPLLEPGISLAVDNAPGLCVASGESAAIARLEQTLQGRGVEASRIHISIAAHSELVEPILPEFRAYLKSLHLSAPKIPFVSNSTGTWITDEQATDPEYWVRHLRGTVRFSEGVRTAMAGKKHLFLEVGPGNTLSSLVRLHGDAAFGRSVVSSLRHRDDPTDDVAFFRGQLGRLWTLGAKPDWSAVHGGAARRRVPLPTYPFERQRYWIEPGAAASSSAARSGPLEKVAAVERWFHAPVWRRSDAPRSGTPGPEASAPARWLLFVDEGGLGDAVAERLRARGHEAVCVREGDVFRSLGDAGFTVVPQERDHYAQLWEELGRAGKLPTRIAHLWMVTQSEETAVTTTFFHWVQERGFYSLLFLGQALSANLPEDGLRMWVVSNGMQSVSGEPLLHPPKALVLGPCRVMPKEIDGLSCTSVDVAVQAAAAGANGAIERDLGEIAERLVEEMSGSASDEVIALRGADRFVHALEPLALPADAPRAESPAAVLRERGVYWITGGLGGIGLALAEHLARTYKARLLLTGASPVPPREEWARWIERGDATAERVRKLLQLEALGAEVCAVQADVANIEEMRRAHTLARERFGSIHGVVHAAGRLEDGLLQTKDPASVDRVFTPKVHGTLLLDELLRDVPLDFFVVFSSTSAVLGPPGQIDYAAANAFLQAFARHRSASGRGRSLAIGWGVWQQIGMAARMSRGSAEHAPLADARAGERNGRAVGDHPLLGARISSSSNDVVFSAEYDADALWALAEHRLKDGLAVLPGTGYLEIARAAGSSLPGNGAVELSDVVFLAPLAVESGSPVEVRCRLRTEGAGHAFEIVSRGPNGTPWRTHAQGRVARLAKPVAANGGKLAIDEVRARTRAESPIGARLPQEEHLRFGPRWNVLRDARFGDREALAHFELGAEYAADLASQALHPALLDVATGFALPLAGGWEPGRFFAPFAYKRVRVYGPLPARGYSHVRATSSRGKRGELALFDVTIADESGRVAVEVEEFAVRPLEGTAALGLARSSGAADRGSPTSRESAPSADALPNTLMDELLRCGILPHEGIAAFERALAEVQGPEVVVTSVEPNALAARIARAAREQQTPRSQFARPELASSYVAPRNALETRLAQMWQELLGVDKVGVRDDFFELGGYSLIAVRLFARIKKEYQLEFPISLLFEAPTVESCAARIREELGEPEEVEAGGGDNGAPAAPRPKKLPFLVPLSSNRVEGKSPFFLVAGMYGNVMNLRHLAGHLGADQLVYGIQAKGLDGQEAPHGTFEEMAADYLRDLRKVQPEGPYLLGGYSGGGITAYEMAQQLRAAGEEVGLLVLLDTPIPSSPEMTYGKRLRLARQRLARQGAAFFTEAVVRKFGDKKRQLRLLVNKPLGKLRPYEFREANIESAFYAALRLYRMQPYPDKVTLFRPPLEEAFVLGPGHVVNARGEWVEAFNGWKEYARGGVDVHVVPGNHDNMVLEPNVRVLASKLRACLAAARQAPART